MNRAFMSHERLMALRFHEMRQLADELGFAFQPEDEFKDLGLLSQFPFYRQTSSNRKVHHVLERKDPMLESRLSVFDLTWVVSTGKSSTRYYQTMLSLYAKDLFIPEFRLQPEGLLERIGAWLGMQDIDIEAYPEFSANNLLRGDDEELVREIVVKPGFAHLFRLNREWHVEGIGYFLVLYKSRDILTVAEIREMLEKAGELRELFRQPG